MTKYYVELYYPGLFFSETSIVEIKDRTETIKMPRNCFGFMYFDITETIVDGELLTGTRENISKFHYFGEVYTLKDIQTNFPEKDILISNMKNNDDDKVVLLRCGNFQPFENGDKIISYNKDSNEFFYDETFNEYQI